MSQALTLARPYARAAFALARDAGKLSVWSDALGFAARFAADPQVAALLGHPRLGRDDAVALLLDDGDGLHSTHRHLMRGYGEFAEIFRRAARSSDAPRHI